MGEEAREILYTQPPWKEIPPEFKVTRAMFFVHVSVLMSYHCKPIDLLLDLYSSRFPMAMFLECVCQCSRAKNRRLGEPDSVQATCVKLFSITSLGQNVLAAPEPRHPVQRG